MNSSALVNGLTEYGVSRRAFLKYCALVASCLALPASGIPALEEALRQATRPAVIWLSFQECTGCTESLTRSYTPSIEELIFDLISLDYHHTLQAASGEAAEAARQETMQHHAGKYWLIVDGSIPMAADGVYSTIAGRTNLDMLREGVANAAIVVAVGSCAAFGGLAAAQPNPTGASSVAALMQAGLIATKPLVNLPGCPPLPIAISSLFAYLLAFERLPDLDALKRPLSIYGNTVHDRCSRYRYYAEEKFAERFGDEGHRKGWCLYKLGCKGPVTHNACSLYKWNQGTSSPIEAGHPCLGCSEPDFWDKGSFYHSLDKAVSPVAPIGKTPDIAIETGQKLYAEHCVSCHAPSPASFKTPAEDIPALLRSDNIRAHRRFELSDEQLELLGKYFTAQQ